MTSFLYIQVHFPFRVHLKRSTFSVMLISLWPAWGWATGLPTGTNMIATDWRQMGVDMEQIEKAHQLYQKQALGSRDDAVAMQHLIPGWKFDNKKPRLVR